MVLFMSVLENVVKFYKPNKGAKTRELTRNMPDT